MTNKEFAQWVYDAAKSLDIDPIFVTAQAALETGWGKSRIGKYNLFGITKGTWTGRTQLVKTREVHSTANYAYFAPGKLSALKHYRAGDTDTSLCGYSEITTHWSNAWKITSLYLRSLTLRMHGFLGAMGPNLQMLYSLVE